MGIKAIKSVEPTQSETLKAVFTYQNMVRYKVKEKVQHNYEFLEQIGSGSEGQVFRARCKLTGNIRAIKKINKFRNPKTKENLLAEFQIHKDIDHPNIVKMYEMYEEDIFVYIVTQICEGKELFDMIMEEQIIGKQTLIFAIFYEIAVTINFLHKNHIMHRDIKPENIIVKQESDDFITVKLIDLGTALKFSGHKPITRKRIGTSYYIAPEVLKRQYNELCDVWSLGVMLYIMFSGSPPFKGKTDLDVLKSIESGTWNFPDKKWKSVSASAKQLINKMLDRNISTRIKAVQILQSAWVKNCQCQYETKLKKQKSMENGRTINQHLSNMKNFKQLSSTPIQEGLFIFIVNFIQNKGNEKEFLQTFQALDTNRDGVISLQELTTGLEKYLNMKPSQCLTIAKKIFEKVDVNSSGSIDYSEFVMSATNVQIVITEDNIDLAFKYIDTDQSGKLSVQEIREKLGDNISDTDYDNLLREFDKNSDGEISKYEFRDMMKSLVAKTKRNDRVQVSSVSPNKISRKATKNGSQKESVHSALKLPEKSGFLTTRSHTARTSSSSNRVKVAARK